MIEVEKLRTAYISLKDEFQYTYGVDSWKLVKIIEINKTFIRYFGEWDKTGNILMFIEKIIPFKDIVEVDYIFDDELINRINLSLAQHLNKKYNNVQSKLNGLSN